MIINANGNQTANFKMGFSFPNIYCFQVEYKEWYSNNQRVEITTNIQSFC